MKTRYSDPFPVLVRITYRDRTKPSVIQYVSRKQAAEWLEKYGRAAHIERPNTPVLIEPVTPATQGAAS